VQRVLRFDLSQLLVEIARPCQITGLDAGLKASLKNLRNLVRAWMPALLTEPGIGPVSAAQLLTILKGGGYRTV